MKKGNNKQSFHVKTLFTDAKLFPFIFKVPAVQQPSHRSFCFTQVSITKIEFENNIDNTT